MDLQRDPMEPGQSTAKSSISIDLRKSLITTMLAAVCVASRLVLTFSPNIKPVTFVLVFVTVDLGLSFGLLFAFLVTALSCFIYGFSPAVTFQFIAWALIACIARILKKPLGNKWFLYFFSFFSGYLFGFFVSFERLMYLSVRAFWAYYITGLGFDTLHAAGNLFFAVVMRRPIQRLFIHYGCGPAWSQRP